MRPTGSQSRANEPAFGTKFYRRFISTIGVHELHTRHLYDQRNLSVCRITVTYTTSVLLTVELVNCRATRLNEATEPPQEFLILTACLKRSIQQNFSWTSHTCPFRPKFAFLSPPAATAPPGGPNLGDWWSVTIEIRNFLYWNHIADDGRWLRICRIWVDGIC